MEVGAARTVYKIGTGDRVCPPWLELCCTMPVAVPVCRNRLSVRTHYGKPTTGKGKSKRGEITHWVRLGKDHILDHESSGTETRRNGSLSHNDDEAYDSLPTISMTRLAETHKLRTTRMCSVWIRLKNVVREWSTITCTCIWSSWICGEKSYETNVRMLVITRSRTASDGK